MSNSPNPHDWIEQNKHRINEDVAYRFAWVARVGDLHFFIQGNQAKAFGESSDYVAIANLLFEDYPWLVEYVLYSFINKVLDKPILKQKRLKVEPFPWMGLIALLLYILIPIAFFVFICTYRGPWPRSHGTSIGVDDRGRPE